MTMRRIAIGLIVLLFAIPVFAQDMGVGMPVLPGAGHVVPSFSHFDPPTPTPNPFPEPMPVTLTVDVTCEDGEYLISWEKGADDDFLLIAIEDVNGYITFSYGTGAEGEVLVYASVPPWDEPTPIIKIDIFSMRNVETATWEGELFCQ